MASSSSSSSSKSAIRYHSQLPTTMEDMDRSDHLPIKCIVYVPGGDSKEEAKGPRKLTVISWNICGEVDKVDGGSAEKFAARKTRIMTSLQRIVAEQKPDLILLQEVMTKEEMENRFKKKVTSFEEDFKSLLGWSFARCDNPRRDRGLCTLYRTALGEAKWIPVVLKKRELKKASERTPQEIKERRDEDYADNTLLLEFANFSVYNVQWHYDFTLDKIEEQLKMRIQKRGALGVIVGGDFNFPVAIPGKPYQVNGIVSSVHRDEIFGRCIPGVDWVDACFYLGRDGHCHLAETTSIHPVSGIEYVEPADTYKNLTGITHSELDRNRLCMTVTPAEKKCIQDAIPTHVIEYLQKHDIRVGRCVNAFGKIKLALYCTNKTEANQFLFIIFMKHLGIEQESFTVRSLRAAGNLFTMPVEQGCYVERILPIATVYMNFNVELNKYNQLVRARGRQAESRKISLNKLNLLFDSLFRSRNPIGLYSLVEYLKQEIKALKNEAGMLGHIKTPELVKMYQRMLENITTELNALPVCTSKAVTFEDASCPKKIKTQIKQTFFQPASTPALPTAILADGNKIVCGRHGRIEMYNPENKLVKYFQIRFLYYGNFHDIEILPSGNMALAWHTGVIPYTEIVIVNPVSGELVASFMHAPGYSYLAPLSDNMLAISRDQTIDIYDIKMGVKKMKSWQVDDEISTKEELTHIINLIKSENSLFHP